MARRIFIHAGQHKTGTTSIQHYIERHAGILTGHGITPFRDWTADLSGEAHDPFPCNVKMLANALVRQDLGTPVRLSGKTRPVGEDIWRMRLPALRAALRAVPADTVLLSAEAFAFLREPGERLRLDQLCEGFTMTAVMFLREPGAWRASWAQQIGHGRYADTPEALAGTGIFDLSPGSWLVDHAAIRSFWRDDCRFLSYEDALAANGSIIPAFLLALGSIRPLARDGTTFFSTPAQRSASGWRDLRAERMSPLQHWPLTSAARPRYNRLTTETPPCP